MSNCRKTSGYWLLEVDHNNQPSWYGLSWRHAKVARVSPDYEAFAGNRVKHMEMIQAVVSRLAGNSFLVKGWALTVALALFGFAIESDSAGLAVIGLLAIVPFFALDAYFLQAERLFRVLYDEVREAESTIEPFFLNATSDSFREAMTKKDKDVSWQATTWRPTLLVYYGGLVAAGVFAAVSAA